MTSSAYEQASPNSFGPGDPNSAGRSSSHFFEGVIDAFRSWKPGTWTPFTIGVTVVAFVVAWPIGLGLLAYNLWGQNMRHSCRHRNRGKWSRSRRYHCGGSGNEAFDEYREETLRRLEEEQAAFAEYLERLRRAKDQEEFDSFMAERRNGSQSNPPDHPPAV